MQQSSEGSTYEYVGTLNIVRNWQRTPEAKHYVNALVRYNRRKTFGERAKFLVATVIS